MSGTSFGSVGSGAEYRSGNESGDKSGAGGGHKDLAFFLRRLLDIDGLAHVEDDWVETKMISTYDRSGGNYDGLTFRLPDGSECIIAPKGDNRPLRPGEVAVGPGDRVIVADLEGPGCIDRFYAGTPGGHLRIFVDDRDHPIVDAPCPSFFNGELEAFPSPLAGRRGASYYCFVPIPFARRCRIEIEGTESKGWLGDFGFGSYYQVSYRRFADGTPVESFSETLSPAERELLRRRRDRWSALGSDPRGDVAYEWIEGEATLAPGESVTLCRIDGEGIIGQFWIVPLEPEETSARSFLRRNALAMYWDGAPFPSVHVPLGDFFGYGLAMRYPFAEEAAATGLYTSLGFKPLRPGDDKREEKKHRFRSLMMGMTDEGYYSFWPMPFANGARIEVRSLPFKGEARPSRFRYRIGYRLAPVGEKTVRFHAQWRQSFTARVPDPNPADTNNYVLLERSGQGHYVGCNLNVFALAAGWWGEGDPMIKVDDDTWPPSYHGTGTEEYFNDGWGFRPGHAPVSGCIVSGWNSDDFFGPNAVYTHHLGDRVGFRKRIRVSIEAWPLDPYDTNYYSSTAYWYELPPLRPVSDLPANRVPTLRFAVEM